MTGDDMDLVRQYAQTQSEDAFATLVSRHVHLVYSVALRHVQDTDLAQEVTQSVFVILARKANSLGSKTILSGWLCRTTCFASSKALTMRQRRLNREHEAYLESSIHAGESHEAWAQIENHLESAMSELGEKDQDALVMRFLQGQSFKEVSVALGISEAGAKMRVSRALEKLRGLFVKRGVILSSLSIASAISTHSLQAAPAGLAGASTLAALNGTNLTSSLLILTKKTLKLMAMAKIKTAAALGVVGLLTVGISTMVLDRSVAAPAAKQNSSMAYTTPEATLQTLVAALKAADIEKFAEGCTPKKAEEFRNRNMGKSEEELKVEAARQAQAFSQAKILSQEKVSETEVHLKMQLPATADGMRGRSGVLTLVMMKVDGLWKYDGDRR
ncbi:MAG: sigma-70 family RNA polymerase sigma factor [Verrucomicrobiota bacterium]|nr:sigma-70 family RNA polymerase sigma factor [Verrucomicrobiota bacterium]